MLVLEDAIVRGVAMTGDVYDASDVLRAGEERWECKRHGSKNLTL